MKAQTALLGRVGRDSCILLSSEFSKPRAHTACGHTYKSRDYTEPHLLYRTSWDLLTHGRKQKSRSLATLEHGQLCGNAKPAGMSEGLLQRDDRHNFHVTYEASETTPLNASAWCWCLWQTSRSLLRVTHHYLDQCPSEEPAITRFLVYEMSKPVKSLTSLCLFRARGFGSIHILFEVWYFCPISDAFRTTYCPVLVHRWGWWHSAVVLDLP